MTTSNKAKLDHVTLAVLQNGLNQVCNEMDQAFVRAAFSPVISEGLDRSDGIYHRHTGELIAQGDLGLPIFVGTMQFGTKAVIDRAGDRFLPASWVTLQEMLLGFAFGVARCGDGADYAERENGNESARHEGLLGGRLRRETSNRITIPPVATSGSNFGNSSGDSVGRGRGRFVRARASQDAGHAIVAFVAGELVQVALDWLHVDCGGPG